MLAVLLYARGGQELYELGGGLIRISTAYISRLSGIKHERIRPLLLKLQAIGYITSMTLNHGHVVLQLREPERVFRGAVRRNSDET